VNLRPFKVLSHRFKERLTLWDLPLKEEILRKGPFLWAHGASVGEIRLTLLLLEELKNLISWPFLLTSMTPQGLQIAQEKLQFVLPFPIPFGPPVRRFFDLVKPQGLLLSETEIWPSVLKEARKRKVPVILFNGRLSERSFRRLYHFRFLFQKALGAFALLLVRSEEDGERFLRLGVSKEKIRVTGDLKFLKPFEPQEEVIKELRSEIGLKGEKVIVGGSTHKGEEELLLRLFKDLKREFGTLKLIIAPRHIERAKALKELAQNFGFKVCLRTKKETQWEVMILDTVGELWKFYGLGEVAFVGGTFVKKIGGHNLLEPLVWGIPTVYGPFIQNFKHISERLKAVGAAQGVKNYEELKETFISLLKDPLSSREKAKRAELLFKEGEKALRATVNAIARIFNETTLGIPHFK